MSVSTFIPIGMTLIILIQFQRLLCTRFSGFMPRHIHTAAKSIMPLITDYFAMDSLWLYVLFGCNLTKTIRPIKPCMLKTPHPHQWDNNYCCCNIFLGTAYGKWREHTAFTWPLYSSDLNDHPRNTLTRLDKDAPLCPEIYLLSSTCLHHGCDAYLASVWRMLRNYVCDSKMQYEHRQ